MENHAPQTETSKSRLDLPALRRLFGLARPFRLQLVLAGILILGDTVLSLLFPLLCRNAVDTLVRTHQPAVLNRYALYIAALLIASGLILFTEYILVAWAGNSIVKNLRYDLFAHLEQLPVTWFDHHRSGDTTSWLSNDVSQLQQTLTEDVVRFVGNLVTLLGGIGLAVAIDWRLTLTVIFLLVLLLSYFVLLGPRLRKLNRAGLDALSQTMGGITEALANIRLVKAFARESHEEKRTLEGLQKIFNLNMKASVIEASFNSMGYSGFMIILMGVVWYGGRCVLQGTLTPGSLLAFLVTIAIISGPMGSLAMQYTGLQRAAGASERLFSVLDESTEIEDTPSAEPFPNGPGLIEFENICFSYSSNTPVIKNLNLQLPAGRVTALVGASGSGKTTLAALLYRFYELEAGSIRIDGKDIRQLQRSSLREHIGMVPQEPALFNITLRENIRYGRLEATDEEVEEAARAANVSEFAANLPNGCDTLIGERGVTLSGGQRQRVAIARAVLKNPRILVLDEATSSLDTRSEALVHEALERLMQGRTTMVIAHRLSTVQNAHQIAVLDHGEIMEYGTHAQLMQHNGGYASLHRNLLDTKNISHAESL